MHRDLIMTACQMIHGAKSAASGSFPTGRRKLNVHTVRKISRYSRSVRIQSVVIELVFVDFLMKIENNRSLRDPA